MARTVGFSGRDDFLVLSLVLVVEGENGEIELPLCRGVLVIGPWGFHLLDSCIDRPAAFFASASRLIDIPTGQCYSRVPLFYLLYSSGKLGKMLGHRP